MSEHPKVIRLFPKSTSLPSEPHDGPTLVARFSTKGTDLNGDRWTTLAIYRTRDGYRCVKVRGEGDQDAGSATDTTVKTMGEAKTWFGGGWVVNELFKAYKDGQRVKHPRFG